MRNMLRNRIRFIIPALVAVCLVAGNVRAQFVVESVSVAHGAVDVPEMTDISVTFSEAIAPAFLPVAIGGFSDLFPVDLGLVDPTCPLPPAGIFVVGAECPASIEISGDGRTVTLEGLELQPDTIHTLIVLFALSADGDALEQPSITRFSTGPTLPTGGIEGSVSTTGPSAQGTLLFAFSAPLSVLEESDLGLNIGVADENGDYSLDFVPDGAYHIVAFQVDLSDPETSFSSLFLGTVDEDGNSVSDLLEIAGGAVVSGADVQTTNEGATAAELNTPALDMVHMVSPTAVLGIAAGAGMNLDGTALSWFYIYASIPDEAIWATASVGSFVFPPQPVDLGPDGDFGIALLGSLGVPDTFEDSPTAVTNYLAASGADFLAEYDGAIGLSVVMHAELFAFIEILLEGGVPLESVKPLKRVFDRTSGLLPAIEQVASKRTGEVWIVAFIAPVGPGLYLVAMDDTGAPILVVGSSAARENEAAATAAAGVWAGDAALVSVTTDFVPIDTKGNSIAWSFNYYSAAKDSVLSVLVSAGDRGGVLSTVVLDPGEVPSVSPLPGAWIDSPVAVGAAFERGRPFVEAHFDALATAILSKGLQTGNPDLAIWRFGFTGTAATGETDALEVDIDAQSGIFVAVEDDRVLPEAFALGQNYPNPFNPATAIPYRVADRGHVTLEVFDALGRKVATLVDAVQPAGSFVATWDATGDGSRMIPSGVYVYRLRSGGDVLSRTMMLVK